jgi:PilZ domain
MSSATFTERRNTPRHRLGRLATMIVGDSTAPHYCLVTDFSDEGVQVNSNGLKIPDKFELRFSGDGRFKNGEYEVVWRNDPIVGAKFVGPSPNS